MPTSYRKTLGCMQTRQPIAGVTYGYTYDEYANEKKQALKCAFTLPLDQGDTEMVHTTAPGYSPLTYIPQSLAIGIGRIFNMPIVAMMYLTRLFVAVAYLAMIAFALRLLPVRKWALVGFALLPHAIDHFVNPGGDYMLYGAVSVFIAVIVRSVYLNKTSLKLENTKLLTILSIAATFMVMPKGIFPGICFLPLIVFYGGLKNKLYIKSLIFTIIALVAIAWQKFGVGTVMGEANVEKNSILDFPVAFIKTMYERWMNGEVVYGSAPLGFNADIGMPSVVITAMICLFAMYLLVGAGEDRPTLLSKVQTRWMGYGVLAAALLIFAGSFAALFIEASYLQDDSGTIAGVQVRYFYPAFFALAITPFTRVFITKEKVFRLIVIIGSIIMLSVSVSIFLIRYRWGIL
jgi:uncharacterized membrane protein